MNNRKRFIPFAWMWLILIAMLVAGCSPASQEGLASAKPVDSSTEEQQQTTSKGQKDNPDTDLTKIEGNLSVHFIDVGQGSSQLLIGPTGKSMLIDGGDNSEEETVVQYLKQQGITKIDILIGTHPDADHVGGLDKVIDNFDIGNIYMPKVQANTQTYQSVLQSIKNKNLKVSTAKAGLELDWEPGVDVKMIAPVGTYEDTNEMSAVIHLTYGDKSFLLTGDAETLSEADMLKSGADLAADVLMVGHHGSESSTSQAFLDKVNPTYAVIQVGKDNKYDHPAAKVLERLQAKQVEIFRNDEDGTIIMITDGKELSVSKIPTRGAEAPTGHESDHTSNEAVDRNPAVPSAPQQQENQTTGALTVSASVDDSTPSQNSSVTVTVKAKDSNGHPVKGAQIELNLHYKSKDTLYEGTTDANGTSVITFKIGRAAKGYTVNGDVTVTYQGSTSGTQVSFTPQ